METMREGGCLCAAVRYRATGTPTRVVACHCTLCQRRTGSAFGVSVYFPLETVEFTGASLKSYSYQSDESGRWIETQFCDRCGTTLTWTAEALPGQRGLAGGTFDDRSWLQVKRHAWTRSAQPWVTFPAGAEVLATTLAK